MKRGSTPSICVPARSSRESPPASSSVDRCRSVGAPRPSPRASTQPNGQWRQPARWLAGQTLHLPGDHRELRWGAELGLPQALSLGWRRGEVGVTSVKVAVRAYGLNHVLVVAADFEVVVLSRVEFVLLRQQDLQPPAHQVFGG